MQYFLLNIIEIQIKKCLQILTYRLIAFLFKANSMNAERKIDLTAERCLDKKCFGAGALIEMCETVKPNYPEHGR